MDSLLIIGWLVAQAAAGALDDPVVEFSNGGKPVFSVTFFPDGRRLLAGGWRPRVWNARTGRPECELEDAGEDEPWYVSVSGDGRTVLGYRETTEEIRLWTGETGRGTVLVYPGGRVVSASLAPDGHSLLTLSRTLRIHDLRDFRREPRTLSGQQGRLLRAELSPDGRLAVAASADGDIHLWDVATGRRRTLEGEAPADALAWSGDARILAVAPAGRGIVLWDAGSGAALGTLERSEGALHALALSPDGRWLATAGEKGFLDVYEVGSGRRLARFGGEARKARSAAFSPDSSRFAAGFDDGAVRIWALWPELDGRELDAARAWEALADSDPVIAHAAARTLVRAGAQVADEIARRLTGSAELTRIARVLSELDDPDPATRERAVETLAAVWHDRAFWTALEASGSTEVQARVQESRRAHETRPIRSAEGVRRWRAVWVLERLRAETALENVARGAEQALQTREAKAALRRLRAR